MGRLSIEAVIWVMVAALAAGSASADESANDEEPRHRAPFLDPRLDAADIPRAPAPAARIELLDVVMGIPIAYDRPQAVSSRDRLDAALAGLPSQVGLVEGLAYLIITQPRLNVSSLQLMIDKMARMQDSRAVRWLGVIYRVAPILAHRFLEGALSFDEVEALAENELPSSAIAELFGNLRPQPGSEEERLGLKGFTSTIRLAIENSARFHQNERLLAEIDRVQQRIEDDESKP